MERLGLICEFWFDKAKGFDVDMGEVLSWIRMRLFLGLVVFE